MAFLGGSHQFDMFFKARFSFLVLHVLLTSFKCIGLSFMFNMFLVGGEQLTNLPTNNEVQYAI